MVNDINGHQVKEVHMVKSVNFECTKCGLTSNYKIDFEEKSCVP